MRGGTRKGLLFHAWGMPNNVYEAGMLQRVVIIEFDSVAHANAAHNLVEYGRAKQAHQLKTYSATTAS